jgi:hypothetical protein
MVRRWLCRPLLVRSRPPAHQSQHRYIEADRFRERTKRGNQEDVLAGILAAKKAGMTTIKLNGFIIRGLKHDEIPEVVESDDAERFDKIGLASRQNKWRLDD